MYAFVVVVVVAVFLGILIISLSIQVNQGTSKMSSRVFVGRILGVCRVSSRISVESISYVVRQVWSDS